MTAYTKCVYPVRTGAATPTAVRCERRDVHARHLRAPPGSPTEVCNCHWSREAALARTRSGLLAIPMGAQRRSGVRLLNLGLNDAAVEGLARKDRQRALRLGQLPPLHPDVRRRGDGPEARVEGRARPVRGGDRHAEEAKRGVSSTPSWPPPTSKELVARFKGADPRVRGHDFPPTRGRQLWGRDHRRVRELEQRARRVYRELNDIPASWGTAVNVQAMVFGNLGDTSATGVAFTRDAATGEDLNGEFLVNAQGEDVVAGIRTPQQVTLKARAAGPNSQIAKTSAAPVSVAEELMPQIYAELLQAETRSENTSRTCRTSSSPSRKRRCGCCRRATASAPARRWCASRSEMVDEG